MSELWRTDAVKGFPRPYGFRAKLAIKGEVIEGAFVDCYFKKSRFTAERDKGSMTLCINSLRAISIDDGPSASHTNTIGAGLPYYRHVIDHPHLHRLVDGKEGYAEPLEIMPATELWLTFVAAAKIHLAPVFSLPPGQLELSL
jgi:hypothetical protein